MDNDERMNAAFLLSYDENVGIDVACPPESRERLFELLKLKAEMEGKQVLLRTTATGIGFLVRDRPDEWHCRVCGESLTALHEDEEHHC